MPSSIRLRVPHVLVSAALSATVLSGCAADRAVPDAGPPVDVGPAFGGDAGAPPDVRALPYDTWSYVPIPGTECGNGSPAVLGVNPHEGATEALFVVAGGGACWDAASCLDSDAAVHVREDYTRAIFDAEVALVRSVGWDDRAAPLNPFRTANLVFVPYCTGDMHSGDAVQTYDPGRADQPTHHRGGRNMRTFLALLGDAWPGLATVRAVGFSAGGYGVQFNWGHFAETWPGARLSLLADCAPMVEIDGPLYAIFRSRWNMDTPTGCSACETSFSAYDDHFDRAHPDSRFGLIASTRDRVLTGYFGVPDLSARVASLAVDHLEANPTTRHYIVDSADHVLLGQATTLRSADGTLLLDWLLGWLSNDARFHNTRP